MKKSFIASIVLAFISVSAYSQRNPPDTVKKEFMKKYSSAQSIKWEREGKSEWEAEFILDRKKMSASFDNLGKWLESETVVTEKDLPASVILTVERDFKSYRKGQIEIYESAAINGYELELKKGETSLEIIIDSSGKILKKTDINEEDEKDEKTDKDKN